MYNSILVPLDGSRNAESALPAAISIARVTHAPINLLTIQVPIPILAVGTGVLQPPVGVEEYTVPDEYLRRVAERVAATGVTTVTLGVLEPTAMVLGSVGNEIAHRAEVNHAGLIIMTTHARASVPRMFMGSVARDVVRASKVPVLLIRPPGRGASDFHDHISFRHVLVPLDGSFFSEEVLHDAFELGHLWNARFTLLRVIEPPHLFGVPIDPAPILPTDEAALGELRHSAQLYLDGVADRVRDRGLQVETRVIVEGGPGEAIARAVEECGADLVAMTTHARGGVGALVLGSVANHVIRSVGKPVLLYRPRQV
jgi:nucleotide-binding universal stress UspA family protein